MNCARRSSAPSAAVHARGTHLFLGQLRTQADNVDEILLHDAHVGEVLAVHRLELLALALALFLLLGQALVTKAAEVSETNNGA